MLDIYAGDAGRAAMRLTLEAGDIPGVAEVASTTGAHAARLVEFLLRAVATPTGTGAPPVPGTPYRPASR
jgi:hypothetical protein